MGVRARGASKKIRDPILISATVAASNFKFGNLYNLGFGSSLPRNNFYDQKWRGLRARAPSEKNGTPYLFLQLLKLATSNLVHNLCMVSSLPRNNI